MPIESTKMRKNPTNFWFCNFTSHEIHQSDCRLLAGLRPPLHLISISFFYYYCSFPLSTAAVIAAHNQFWPWRTDDVRSNAASDSFCQLVVRMYMRTFASCLIPLIEKFERHIPFSKTLTTRAHTSTPVHSKQKLLHAHAAAMTKITVE